MTSEPDPAPDGPERADLLHMYVETLRLRLSPEQLQVLGRMIKDVLDFMATGQNPAQAPTAVEDEAVHAELVTIVGILASGRLDQQLVDFGDGIRVLVEADAAADPVRLEALHAHLRRERERRRAQDETLRGIAEASGLAP